MNFEKLTAYIDGLEAQYGVPAADCIILKDHELIYRHMAGHSDHEKHVPLVGNEYYYLFSATKVITITAAMQLIEQGKLSLDDEVSKYLPEYGSMRVIDRKFEFNVFPPQTPTKDEPSHPAQNKIRIIDLMAMMGGLTYDINSEAIIAAIEKSGGKANTRELVRAMAEMPLICEPGTRWVYSLAHDVMGAVIEVVSGEKFSDYLKAHIFAPLGANGIRFTDDNIKAAAMYNFNFVSGAMDPVPQHNHYKLTENYESGGAGLMSTVEAYITVIDALANYGVGKNGTRILSADSVKRFMQGVTTGEALKDFKSGGKGAYSYGLGVRVKDCMESGRTPIGEFGWDGAAGAYCIIDPINRVSLFYVQHILGFPTVYSEIHPEIRDLAYEGLGI